MLVITRKPGEAIQIGDTITVTVLQIQSPDRVRIGIDAPREVPVIRDELLKRKAPQK